MSDQPKHSEEKEGSITDEVRSPVGEFDSEKRIGKSGILTFASLIAIAYIVLLLLGLFSLGSWVGGFLYFLGIHMIRFVIATILLFNGNVNGNKATLYIAVGFYVFSFIAAGDPSWVINHIPPFVVSVLVLIGTIFLRDEEE